MSSFNSSILLNTVAFDSPQSVVNFTQAYSSAASGTLSYAGYGNTWRLQNTTASTVTVFDTGMIVPGRRVTILNESDQTVTIAHSATPTNGQVFCTAAGNYSLTKGKTFSMIQDESGAWHQL